MPLAISPRLLKRTLTAIVVMPIVLWLIINGKFPFLVMLGFWGVFALYEWFQLSMKTKHKAVFLILGVFYIGIAFWSCFLIRVGTGIESSLAFIVMIWASDIGGYVVGKCVGGPKMSPTISPNKTWAGFVGSMIFPGVALVFMTLMYDFYNAGWPHGYDWPRPAFYALYFVLGATIGFVGQSGDLLMSAFKRYVGVKDSGDIMPGHGGVLDRIDSLLLTAPVYFAIMEAIQRHWVVS